MLLYICIAFRRYNESSAGRKSAADAAIWYVEIALLKVSPNGHSHENPSRVNRPCHYVNWRMCLQEWPQRGRQLAEVRRIAMRAAASLVASSRTLDLLNTDCPSATFPPVTVALAVVSPFGERRRKKALGIGVGESRGGRLGDHQRETKAYRPLMFWIPDLQARVRAECDSVLRSTHPRWITICRGAWSTKLIAKRADEALAHS